VPLLDKGDLIVDGGNTLYTDTARREQYLASKGLRFIGAGISGGEEGALKGPSIMPSGDPDSWQLIQPIFEAIAARVDGEPCVTHIGLGGSGHFVKMVHNGIEYGDMQLICEAYHIFKAAGFTNAELADIFDDWNKGDLESYLIEITANIFRQHDSITGQDLVDVILDRAGQKGTGRWTAIVAVEQAIPLSAIAGSVEARILSSMLDKRAMASETLAGPDGWHLELKPEDKTVLIKQVHNALYASKVVSYAQGLDLIAAVGATNEWNLDLAGIARIWRGGCIIRAKFLDHISQAYIADPSLINLMLAPFFTAALNRSQQDWRETVALAVKGGIPVPSVSGALSYYDAYRSARLPANLLQAQRDFFGAHTYERTDAPRGQFFHTDDWPALLD
jgi:6-phosphogluconate dehydrogenase